MTEKELRAWADTRIKHVDLYGPYVPLAQAVLALLDAKAQADADMAMAAGELLVPIPEPGTDMARLLSANVILRYTKAQAERERNEAKDVARQAFVDGAAWMLYQRESMTMFASERAAAEEAAERRYPYAPWALKRDLEAERTAHATTKAEAQRQYDQAVEATGRALRAEAALHTCQDELTQERTAHAQTKALLRDVAASGVEFQHPSVDYVIVQMDAETWQQVKALSGTTEAQS